MPENVLTLQDRPAPDMGLPRHRHGRLRHLYLYEAHKNSTSTASTSADTSGTTNPGGQGQVPQYVGVTENDIGQENYQSNVNSPGGQVAVNTGKGGTASNSSPKPVTPPPVGTKPPAKAGYARQVSTGGTSLAEFAKERNTTVKALEQVTEESPEISHANLVKFDSYIKGGTSKPMPKGLVFYTQNQGSAPGAQNVGGGGGPSATKQAGHGNTTHHSKPNPGGTNVRPPRAARSRILAARTRPSSRRPRPRRRPRNDRGTDGGKGLEGFGLGLVLAMEVPNLFSAPLPSKFTIATFSQPDQLTHTRRWIRSGEIEGVLQAILLGIGGSLVTSSPWPFLLVIAMTVWKVMSYEDALKNGTSGGLGLDMKAGAA